MKKLLFSLLLISSIAIAANPADFTVKSATGSESFTLKEAKGKYLAVHFLLKTECPVCLRHTHDHFAKSATLPNVVQLFLKPDTDQEIEAWAKKLPPDELVAFPDAG